MAKRKRKILPKNFESLLQEGDSTKLRAVFDDCEIDARGGYAKQTALAFDNCPDDLARWLVSQGADLSATDTWGNTPLHARARSRRSSINILLELGADVNNTCSSIGTPLHAAADSHNAKHARQLLEHGARVNERNRKHLSPLELALRGCNNIDIENMVALAEVLLDSGAERTPQTKKFVEEIGKRFEFHRSGFNPKDVNAASNALGRLYEIFEVLPVSHRQIHDGTSPVVVKAKTWQKQHQELWELLVPSSGHAATIQGEVIRISGRVSNELLDNGGGNWNADYKMMADAFLEYVQQGVGFSPSDFAEAASIVAEVKRKSGDTSRMAQLAVKWVLQNPAPLKLKPPSYQR
ncbi:MAG: ankyrin repeat domain-containing protein [Planctomycetia bacterium]|nr:ankyrin repeat domain-containing protein [Planctomycetia bacterium]